MRPARGLGGWLSWGMDALIVGSQQALLSRLFDGMPDSFVADVYNTIGDVAFRAQLGERARGAFLRRLDETFALYSRCRGGDLARLLEERRRARDAWRPTR